MGQQNVSVLLCAHYQNGKGQRGVVRSVQWGRGRGVVRTGLFKMSIMDDLFDNSPFTKHEEPAESDPPASISVEQDVTFGFPSEVDANPTGNGFECEQDEEPVSTFIATNEPTTPHDDIKVSVKSYETVEDDFIFSVEVSSVMLRLINAPRCY